MTGEESRDGKARSVLAADTPGIDITRLAQYLPAVLDDFDPAAELRATLMSGGRSNLTCLLSQPGRRWVLRRPPLGHVMPTAHDMAREFRMLGLLADRKFPVPRPLALCEDDSVLGVAFMVMQYVPGLIVSSAQIAGGLVAGDASHVCHELVTTMADLHALPPPSLPPGHSMSSGHYLDRQVTRWIKQWQHTSTRDLPAFGQLAQWLRAAVATLPTDHSVSIVHGDYRLDNLVFDPVTKVLRAVLDWEMSTLGDPLMDLGLLLVYWEQPGDGLRSNVAVARDLTAAPGFWSRDRLVREYAAASGLPMDQLDVRIALSCLKLAAVMESIHYRYLNGQALDQLSAGLAGAAPALLQMGLRVAQGEGLQALAA